MGNLCIKSESLKTSEFKTTNPLKSVTDVTGDDDDSKIGVVELLSEESVRRMPSLPTNLEVQDFSRLGSSLMAVFTDSFKLNISMTAPIEMALRCLCGLAVYYSKVCFSIVYLFNF